MLGSLGFYDIVAYFLIYSCLGWAVEVIYHVLKQGIIVNRGYLNGPVCPIYGFGMLAIIVFLMPFQSNKYILLLGGMILSTVIELIGGYALYHFFHLRWWDYSGERFNIGGYICLKFTIYWGVGAVLVMELVHPPISFLVNLVPHNVGIVLMVILCIIYAIDVAATTVTVMKMKKEFERLAEIGKAMREVSDTLTEGIGGTAMAVGQKVGESQVQMALAKAELKDKTDEAISELKDKTEEAILEIKDKTEEAISELREKTNDAKEEFDRRNKETKEELENKLEELNNKRHELEDKLTKSRLLGSGRILTAFPNLKKHL